LTDDRAFGADDVARPRYAGGKLRKLRFLMTDNTVGCFRALGGGWTP